MGSDRDAYHEIAHAIEDSLPGDWSTVEISVIAYDDGLSVRGKFATFSGVKEEFPVPLEAVRAFRALRMQMVDGQQIPWGQAKFELDSNGSFEVKLGYDNCDDKGNTIWND